MNTSTNRQASTRRLNDHLFSSALTVTFFSLFLVLGSAIEARAQGSQITIKNERNQRVKVCVYKNTNALTWLRPVRCWTLSNGETVVWNQGGSGYRYNVRVFKPAILDEKICEKRAVWNSDDITIQGKSPCILAKNRHPARSEVSPKQWSDGDRVLVNAPGDAYWYPGVIERKRSNREYFIMLENGKRLVIDPKYISGDYIREGTRVYGNWKRSGRYYAGRIASRNGNAVSIDYDDGDKETTSLRYTRFGFNDLPSEVKQYTVKICNNQNEKVWFTLSYGYGRGNYFTEGWWYVNPKGCYTIDLSDRWRRAGHREGVTPRTFIYGETEGLFGGAIKKAWQGADRNFTFCINEDRSKSFRNTEATLSNNVPVRNPCDSPGQERVRVNALNYPRRGTQLTWTFR
ncbi:MAG: DUF1036 domain-containing protein [Acidobacteria bacterium]|nr:MAG: DUF1036 domain-containing protein [Acidobacteriota bacterium]REK04085.1 MAG: DUF1036 domain-containing protein [Acidobacteriota bacterium]REK15247.1 MAG: DUF1036 domain-containing protein [Acidobacteriota bacterium]REK46337.1 MAG: DUF1036 domain-containing protein [Acidobacteriota bacterium]